MSSAALRRWLLPGPLIVILIAAAAFLWASPEPNDTVGAAGIMIGYAAASYLILRRSRRLERRERNAWRGMAYGAAIGASGILFIAILTEAGYQTPAFGPADAFFIGGYAMLIVGIYRLARAEGSGRDWFMTLLDAAVGGIALAAIVWVSFFSDLVDALDQAQWWEIVVAITYPILDLAAIVGLMILVIRRSHYRLDARLIFLALAMCFQVLSDWLYLSSGIGRTFEEATPSFSLLLLAVAAEVVVAAIVDVTPAKREFPEQETPIWAMIWPYLLAASVLSVHVGRYRILDPDMGQLVPLNALILIGAAIFLRQMLTIHRNRQRVEKQRSELVASVSHELRTPLTAVVGYLSVLEEDADQFPESARDEMIAEAADQARHMSRLVSDLVMLARGTTRSLPLEVKEVEVPTIATAALRSLEPRNTRIEERLETTARARVDADRMQQALSNLLTNAIRYGGGRALLVAKTVGDDLVVEVHDDGNGVPTRYETMIWNRFERGAHRLDATTPGLGIGLAIVQSVAESHGGKASYSRSGELGGACFSIVIPGCVVDSRERLVVPLDVD